MRPGPISTVVIAAAVIAAACSGPAPHPSRRSPSPTLSASRTPPPVLAACPIAARAMFRAAAGVDVRVASRAEAGLTTCEYQATPPVGAHRRAACTAASLRIDTASQALVDFHRYVDEAVQNSSVPGQKGLAPIQVSAPELGPQVEWVPARRMLDTAVAGRWLTVTTQCEAGGARSLALARRLAATAVAH